MSYDRKDFYYREAKNQGYRARSAFKLEQINKKFKIIKRGGIIVDLGAAPGGWSQIASKIVGNKGKVIAVDINFIRPFNEENILILQADMRSRDFLIKLKEYIDPGINTVISDLASNTSGSWHLDCERQIHLATLAFETTLKMLKKGGNFMTKVFRGPALKEFEDRLRGNFKLIKHWRPPATRKKSAEEYIVCKGFQYE